MALSAVRFHPGDDFKTACGIVCSFRRRAGFGNNPAFEPFDRAACQRTLLDPLARMLDTAPRALAAIVVVTCGDGGKFSEEVLDGNTPTTAALREAFPSGVRAGRIIPRICTDWGRNTGSATALNDGLKVADEIGADYAFIWSPELAIDGRMFSRMLAHQQRNDLLLVGYLRQNPDHLLQYQIAQNTCASWDLRRLMAIGGFDRRCNGDGKTTVTLPSGEQAEEKGMEDQRAYLEMSRQAGRFLPWGMVGRDNPAKWEISHPSGSDAHRDHLIKVSRQWSVALAYARELFPNQDPNQVYEQILEVGNIAP